MRDLLRLLALFRPYWTWMAGSILLALASVLANVALMGVSGWFITAMAIAGAAGVSMNYFTPAAMIRAFAITRTAGRYAERVVSHEATFRLLAGLRTWFYERIEPLAPARLQDLHSGDLLTRISADIDRLELFFLRLFVPAVVALLSSAVVVAVLAFYVPLLGLAELALLVAAGVLLPVVTLYLGRHPSARLTRRSAELNVRVVDMVDGLAELQVYGVDQMHADRIMEITDAAITDETRLAGLSGLSQAGVGFAANLALWAALVIAIPAVLAKTIAPADLAMLGLVALASFEAIGPVPLAISTLSGTLESARRLFTLADAEPAVAEPAVPAEPPSGSDLVFSGVGLSYPDAATAAVTDFDLSLSPGRRVAVLGPSGAGKSSLVALALRFRDPTAGAITLGGVPVTALSGEDVRRRIAVVAQYDHLFTGTILDNLRIARPEASLDEIAACCRLARIDDFIAAQPDRYDTLVGTNGLKLSGGEARRLAVARALLKDAPILMLDEPTEGMDRETAEAVMAGVLEASADRALLIITHRPIALEQMDDVLVMDRGRVVKRGTAAELRGDIENYLDVTDLAPR